MGKVKLTLTIESSLLENAKLVAKKEKTSLSNMIEGFLSGFENVKYKPVSIADELRGIAKSELSKKTDKQIKEMMYAEKFGI